MADEDPYRRPASALPASAQAGDASPTSPGSGNARAAGLKGLGGWLIAVAIVLGWSLLRAGMSLSATASLLTLGGVSFGSMFDLSDPLRAPLQFVFASGCALAALNLVALVLFFMKSRWFPRAFIVWWVAKIALAAVIVLLVRRMADMEQFLLRSMMIELAYALSFGAFWIAYTLRSRRVKNTFGLGRDAAE
ncbi:DUF2569 family protein [Pseudomonas sp. CGJS7]|uniref:DUF2569 family protein n=1 Tax=Pseudomonas sp. CGJS7 TaxID=3109348 RepID=UPI003008C17B